MPSFASYKISTALLASIALMLVGQISSAMAEEISDVYDVIGEARFEEPLIATNHTSEGEDQALAAALVAYDRRESPEDTASLEAYLAEHPGSGWSPSLQTNLGLIYLHYGYFSKALNKFQISWEQAKDAQSIEAKSLADRAVGELAKLKGSLGQLDELKSLLEEVGTRSVSGPATEALQTAAEIVDRSKKEKHHLFICGPLALKAFMRTQGAGPAEVESLRWYNANDNGTSLAELSGLADQMNVAHALIYRETGSAIPVPSIVHWKVGHFAAIVGEADGRYKVQDPVLPQREIWMSQAAIDFESSGYFLVSPDAPQKASWGAVSKERAATIWGRGQTSGTTPGIAGPQDPPANPTDSAGSAGSAGSSGAGGPWGPGGPGAPEADSPGTPPPCTSCACPMCDYNIGESTVSLTLQDAPIGYRPPVGPPVFVTLRYNQREGSQPANFNYFNVGQKWTMDWLTFITDDPGVPGSSVSRYVSGGGAYFYTGYQSLSGAFMREAGNGALLIRTDQGYRRQLGDGSVELYEHSDGSASYPRRLFLSQLIDPQGNTIALTYDAQQRLISITDAIGQQTILAYQVPGRPLLVSKITDPYGRSAAISYDGLGRLESITDVIGITSSVTYDVNSLVNSLTTPYGTTSFSYTAPGTGAPPRFVQITDPLGYSERVEWLEPSPVSSSDPAETVPVGMPLAPGNQYLEYRNSFYWNKQAYADAGCTPSGGCDYSKARIRHFLHDGNLKSNVIESVKYPLENRIWFNYPGQTNSVDIGTFDQPVAAGRVLDDGSTQITRYAYDTTGYYKLLQTVDPLGRTTSLSYANQIDPSAITQTTQFGERQLIAQIAYNSKHRPILYTDAAEQTWRMAYNERGQLLKATDPEGRETTYQYDEHARLISVTNANNEIAATYTYDSYYRISTFTDSEGWQIAFDYDPANRLTRITYPDGTFESYTYKWLDLSSYTDRQGRTWKYERDANRRLVSLIDPRQQQQLFGYNRIGNQTSRTDPMGYTTGWSYDLEQRLSTKTYPDTTVTTYTYESTTSRLKSIEDALGQKRQFSYANDDRLVGKAYLEELHPTPDVAFTYDPYFPRITSMEDGNGTTAYSYYPIGSIGALRLAQESGPLANSDISYVYDEVGRVISRSMQGGGPETFEYDTLGRVVSHTSTLGEFAIEYLGQTNQITRRALANSTLETTWSYLPNVGDRRLESVGNIGLSGSQFSHFTFATTADKFIMSIDEDSDVSSVYPASFSQNAGYNNLNQLSDLSGQPLTYDLVGNLLSDGHRNFTWDAENRLIGITYPAEPGKATAFSYDGLTRRTAIYSTPTGGGPTATTTYAWCGSAICQARDANNAIVREYFSEGEITSGSPAQAGYYGVDQIASVRRVFISPTIAPAYSYDPFGVELQSTPHTSDFGYAGLFYNADSGLYLAQYRVYDPNVGRWLSRDPLGEQSDPAQNLYSYVGAEPISRLDPSGLQAIPSDPRVVAGVTIVASPVIIGSAVASMMGAQLHLYEAINGPLGAAPAYNQSDNPDLPPRGLPPAGILPPIPNADQCIPGPASRPSEREKGGQSLWDPDGGEWRWFPGDRWHNPHWDYNPHDTPNPEWQNVPHGDKAPRKDPPDSE